MGLSTPLHAWFITSASTLVGCDQFKLAQTSSDQLLVHMIKRNSMACHITSNSDFDQGGYVMQIEWTNALCNNCQPILLIIVYGSQTSISDI